MNYSKQRELILQTVTLYAAHMTAEEVYAALHSTYPTLSLATVYRNLNQLAQHGLLLKINVSNGRDRFDHRLDEHYHLVCQTCSGVFDIELPTLTRLLQKSTAQSGFVFSCCDVLLHGICPVCKAVKTT